MIAAVIVADTISVAWFVGGAGRRISSRRAIHLAGDSR
jgi:hypothetical protein